MIEFIICEDNLLYLSTYTNIIEKVLMNYDVEYHTTYLDNYKTLFKNTMKDKIFKIYIISIEKGSLEAIKYIREKYDDWQSMIIVLGKEEKKATFYDGRFLLVDYIDKDRDYEERLKSAIQVSLKNYDKRPNKLKYTYKKIMYSIDFSKILYIEKEQDNKRCIIKTEEKEYYIQGNLNQIEKLLDKRFIKCSRSYIINVEQVESYNTKKNLIIFQNGVELYAISRNKKKEFLNTFRKI